MSRTYSWYLEQKIDGVWHQDERPWYPPDSPIDLAFFTDVNGETDGLSLAVNRVLSTITHKHFPHDPSFEVDEIVSRSVAHAAEEFLQLPSFGWLIVGDILNADWSTLGDAGTAKREAINAWLEHLKALGDTSHLRLIYMLW